MGPKPTVGGAVEAALRVEGLHQALGPALDAISAQDAQDFFRYVGYSRLK